MAGEYGTQETLTLQATADLTAKRYHVLRVSSGVCNQASDALNSGAIGVLQNNPGSGEAATVAYLGISKAVAGAAVTGMGLVTTNGSGRVIDAVSGSWTIGRTLDAGGADGTVISVLLQPGTRTF